MAGFGGNSSGPIIGYNPFNPSSVGMKPGTSPYLGNVQQAAPKVQPNPNPPAQTLGAEGILATGKGPGGAAYGQNLATYAGGQFMRPQGGLQFNPFNINQTQFGQNVGGGNAPNVGIPQTLLGQAQGGQSFAPTPPATSNLNATSNPSLGQYSIEQLFSSPQGGLNY